RKIDAFAAPFARQRAHVFGRHAGFGFLPFGRLGDAILLAQQIRLPLVEADGMGCHVFLVVETFLDPDIGDGHGHRGRGRRPRRKPLARQELRRRVVVWIDVDDLDAELRVLEPLPAYRALLGAVRTARALRVRGPEHDHLAALEAVLDGAVGLALADAQRVAPVMGRAPVPAFPGIGVVMDLGMADGVAEAIERRQVVADIAPGVMRAMRYRHHARPISAFQLLDLVRDEIERLIPRDSYVAGLAAVLRV